MTIPGCNARFTPGSAFLRWSSSRANCWRPPIRSFLSSPNAGPPAPGEHAPERPSCPGAPPARRPLGSSSGARCRLAPRPSFPAPIHSPPTPRADGPFGSAFPSSVHPASHPLPDRHWSGGSERDRRSCLGNVGKPNGPRRPRVVLMVSAVLRRALQRPSPLQERSRRLQSGSGRTRLLVRRTFSHGAPGSSTGEAAGPSHHPHRRRFPAREVRNEEPAQGFHAD